jgi:hypothetical protein
LKQQQQQQQQQKLQERQHQQQQQFSITRIEMKVEEWNSADESNHDFGNKRNSLIF